jgi:hypothetical protein
MNIFTPAYNKCLEKVNYMMANFLIITLSLNLFCFLTY